MSVCSNTATETTAARCDAMLRVLLVLVIIAGTTWVARPFVCPTRLESELHAAAVALATRRFDVAWSSATRALEINPKSTAALLLAGSAAAGRFDDMTAIGLLERVPVESEQALLAELALGYRLQCSGRVDRAERQYRKVLSRDPYHPEANRRLGFLLQSQGRTSEAVSCLGVLIMQGTFNGDELLGVSTTERYYFSDETLEARADKGLPADLLIDLGKVRYALTEGREQEVLPQLRSIISQHPHVAEARARLGRIVFDVGDRAEFLAWNEQLTPEHEQHPEIWFVRGLFASREGTIRTAVRCFAETLLRDPNHHAANHQIAGCLSQLGRTELAQEFSERADSLAHIDVYINVIRNTPTAEAAEPLIQLLQKLGRHWEAAGWAYVASRFGSPPDWWREVYFSEARKLRYGEGLTAHASQPARRLDLSRFPVPDWPRSSGPPAVTRDEHRDPVRVDEWSFADQARDAGVNFQYYEGSIGQARLQHIFQAIGGGVGVVDFDRDGRPDLYFPQANDWRRPVSESTTIDRLFRNAGEGRFDDVTDQALLEDPEFSYGLAVGDYDNDGFPDIYVGNLMANRLYHNNGDGTFRDVTEASGTRDNAWTTSCAFADLNADGLPDLFVANYSDREFAVRNPCYVRDLETSCSPDRLPGTMSQCFVNLGDGRFADVSQDAGILSGSGKGLGLVIADFRGDGRSSVFVGNDSTGNFYFRNLGADAHGVTRFSEQGGISGLAFDVDGNAQACMGIAAGDANGDGRLDLLTTNFMKEGSTLFVQLSDGMFLDATRRAGLREPTYKMLGFGAQFLDVDNDGWEDCVMTNGHVSRPDVLGGVDSDKMPPQLFANQRDGTFAEVDRARLGSFFETKSLGRGLAVLDWNRDGRQDFCVSHIQDPIALVTNQTPVAGHRLVVQLIGTRCSRDAVAAIGTARVGGRTLVRHLTGGNGFLAVNEPRLWFGLGPDEGRVDELIIAWPGGATQRFRHIQADREIVIIEGRIEPVILNAWPPLP